TVGGTVTTGTVSAVSVVSLLGGPAGAVVAAGGCDGGDCGLSTPLGPTVAAGGAAGLITAWKMHSKPGRYRRVAAARVSGGGARQARCSTARGAHST